MMASGLRAAEAESQTTPQSFSDVIALDTEYAPWSSRHEPYESLTLFGQGVAMPV